MGWLGYYARARNLHKTAQIIAAEHGGIFPADQKTLLALPGIGPYTASAIMVMGYGQPGVVVDGNIERVMSRFLQSKRRFQKQKKTLPPPMNSAAQRPAHQTFRRR